MIGGNAIVTAKGQPAGIGGRSGKMTIQDNCYVTATGLLDGDAGAVKVTVEGAKTEAGDYTATAVLAGDKAGNYSLPEDATRAFTIKAAKSGVITAPTAVPNLTYTGKPRALVSAVSAVNGTMQYSIDGENWSTDIPTGTDAVRYIVYYRVKGNNGYAETEPQRLTATIAKAALTVRANDHTITYGDEPTNNGVVFEGFVNNETQGDLDGKLAWSYNYAPYGDVGSYVLTPDGLTSDNYEITLVSGILTVAKKTVELVWGTKTTFTFDGGSHVPTATVRQDSLVHGDTIGVTVDGAMIDAGNHTATAIGLTGDKAGNYKLPDANTQAFTIDQADALQLEDITLYLNYKVQSVDYILPSVMPEDAGKLTYQAGTWSTESGVKVSEFKVENTEDEIVKVSAKLTDGKDAAVMDLPVIITSDNYKDTTAHVKVHLVDKIDAGVTITDPVIVEGKITKTYGDSPFPLTASVTDPGTGTGTRTWTSSNTDVAEVNSSSGEVTVKNHGVTTLTATYISDTTYGQATVTLTVNPKSINGATVEVSRNYTYSGLVIRPADSDVIVKLDGRVLESGVDYSFTGTQRKDVATPNPVLTVNGNGNYTGEVKGTYIIVPAPLIVTTGSASKDYDGIPLTNGVKSVSGLVHGETLIVNVTGSQTDVGRSDNTFTIDWTQRPENERPAKKDNYILKQKPGTLEVAKNDSRVTLTAASASKTYDGTELTNSTVTATGLPEGFTVEATARGSQTDAGSSANVIDTGYVIKNAGGEDKTACFTNVKRVDGELTILPKSIANAVVTLDQTSFNYDSTAKTVKVTDVTLDGNTLVQDTDYTVSGTDATDAGTYTVTVTGKGNYADAATATWTITAGNMTVEAKNVVVDYDGEPHGIAVDVTEPIDGWTVKYGTKLGEYSRNASPTRTAAGTLVVYYRVTADNYNACEGYATVTVKRASFTPTVSIDGWVYGQAPNEPGIDENPGYGAVTFSYSNAENGNYTENVPTDAGTWYVKASVEETVNYPAATTEPAPFEITPTRITVTADDKTSTYGESIAELTWQVEGGYVDGDDLGISASTTATSASDAGEYEITLGGINNPNYIAEVKNGPIPSRRRLSPSPPAITAARMTARPMASP